LLSISLQLLNISRPDSLLSRPFIFATFARNIFFVNYSHLFFDLDKTLWDFDANSSASLDQIYTEFNLDSFYADPEEFKRIYNKYNDELWERYRNGTILKAELRSLRFELTLQEKSPADKKLAYDIGERYMYITPRMNILKPNTLSTLDYLKEKNYSLYILTNGFLETQENKMRHSRIDGYFKRLFSSEELGINKPKKEIFHWAVSSIHARKKECLMVGDDLKVDIEGAMNYGMDAIWYNPEGLGSDLKPSRTIQDLAELKTFL